MPDLRDNLQRTLGDAYVLERELGGGGMSRVFVAEDTALGRRIVVKMLPCDTAAAVSLERFKREILVVARLQHPHIVPVLSAGQVGELPFYTMPFVKGESLRTRLQRGGELSVNEAVHVLRDVAAALAYAHGEGVVHRDIKPDNVIVSGGVAVVTDFGVSKAVDIAATDAGKVQTGITSLGIALGTPAYMAPEQASADPHVDHRADIYSFGCLAYELLAGSSPFAGRAPQQILAAHVTDAPEPLLRRRPNVPPMLASLIMKCLEKRAGDRPQSADELLNTLDAIATTPSGGTIPTAERLRSTTKNPRAMWLLAAAVVVVLLIVMVAWQRANGFVAVSVVGTTPIAISAALEREPAISPDGRLVAYTATTKEGDRIFVRQVDGGSARMLADQPAGDHAYPKWSPDGSRVSFVAEWSVFVVPALSGGTPIRIVDSASTHSWAPDGKSIVYSTPDQRFLRLQPVGGGTSRTLVEGVTLHSPVISPDGRTVLYVRGNMPSFNNVSVCSVWSAPANGGQPVRLSDSVHVNLSPIWMPDGRSILFISDMGGARDVYQLPVTHSGGRRGNPFRLTTGLSAYWISMSGDGSRVTYDVVRNFSNVYVAPLQGGVARLSAARPVTRENQHIEVLSLSHDGKWIAYDSDRGGNFDIYKQRIDSGEPIQLTTSPASDFAPAWSADDRQIVFHSTRNGSRDLYVIDADGRNEQQVTSGPSQDFYPSWSPDGRKIVYRAAGVVSDTILIVSRDDTGKWSAPRPVAHAPGIIAVQWSPDGKFLVATESGKVMVHNLAGDSARVIMDMTRSGLPAVRATFGRASSPILVSVWNTSAARPNSHVPRGGMAVYEISTAGGTPRLVATGSAEVRFARAEIAFDEKRLFFTRAAWETNVWMMELKR